MQFRYEMKLLVASEGWRGKGRGSLVSCLRGGRFVSCRFAEGFEGEHNALKSYFLELSCAVAFSCGRTESFAAGNREHWSSVACQVLIKPRASEKNWIRNLPSSVCFVARSACDPQVTGTVLT